MLPNGRSDSGPLSFGFPLLFRCKSKQRFNHVCELQMLLRQHLESLVVLFERNPGLDAATADLYAAAALVNDSTAASQPLTRKRRLLREAQARFQERVSAAHPNGRRACA